ncbi:M55 family metallopeptidase [Rubeoparvulum massiliense]|uniref:M55 family metallopeptidase n=1 Tax=Rubeoparvulum massiliense TaxID=1631346 RepID=UPI00065E0BC6|nr:M55 family metallopeptidase [Rubeoparvulum massiliense]
MKLYVSVDMEGITGMVDETYISSRQYQYQRGQRIMTTETNNVIEAAVAAGATEIIVNDSHSQMNNLLIEDLHPAAKLISGSPKPYSMVQGLDASFTAAIYVGYHARATTPGTLSHTMIFGVRHMWIDDRLLGELGLNAMLAGYYGVPVIMVAGDDYAAREAEELIPGVVTAVVKESISRSAALSLTPAKAGELLQAKTAEALTKLGSIEALQPPAQPVLRIQFVNCGHAELAHLLPGSELEDDHVTVRFAAKDMKEAYQAMLVMTELACMAKFS